MPPFGEAHKLLSATHLDTEAPAAGADPDDGQVATWSDALKAWIAKDPTGGGGSDHGLLDGLADDDHPQYGLLSGRSGGQSLKGGLAASEHLTLQSTAHATRGYVRAQDDLQLLTNILRDSGGNNRIQLATASPHVTLGGYSRLGDRVAIGADPEAGVGLKLPTFVSTTQKFSLIEASPTIKLTEGRRALYAFQGMTAASVSVGATASIVAGLYFTAVGGNSGTIEDLFAAWVRAGLMSYKGPACSLWGLKVNSPMLLYSTYPTTAYGIEIDDQGVYPAATHDAIGLKIADQAATAGNKRLIEAGPATPYLRLVGGADPAANESNLYLRLGAGLKQVTEYDADSAGAGYRALRVPN